MPCCFLGDRPDADAIAAYLLTPNASLRGGEKEFGASRASLRKHRDVCLRGHVAPVMPIGATWRHVGPLVTDKHRESPEDQGNHPGVATVAGGPPALRMGAAVLAISEEEQVTFIASLIEGNRFYYRRTLAWLEGIWKLSATEVRKRYDAAVAKVDADHQLEHAEKVISLAALEAKEQAADHEFRRLRKSDPSQARGYLALSLKARSEYAAIVGLKTTKIAVEGAINIWTRSEVVIAIDRFTETALDVLSPPDEQSAEALLDKARLAAERSLGRSVDAEVVAALGAALLEQLQAEATARFGALAQEGQGAAWQAPEAPELPEEAQAAE